MNSANVTLNPNSESSDSCEIFCNWKEQLGGWLHVQMAILIIDLVVRTRLGNKYFNLSVYLQILGIVASLCRIIWAILDPYGFEQVLPIAETILFNFSVVLWFSEYGMVVVFWIELQKKMRLDEESKILFWRKIVIIVTFLYAIISTISLGVLRFFLNDDNTIGNAIYNFLTTIQLIFLNTLGCVYIIKIWRKFKEIDSNPRSKQSLKYVSTAIGISFIVSTFMIVGLILFTVLDANHNIWLFYALHTVFRIGEILLATAMVSIVNVIIKELNQGYSLKQIWSREGIQATSSVSANSADSAIPKTKVPKKTQETKPPDISSSSSSSEISSFDTEELNQQTPKPKKSASLYSLKKSTSYTKV